MKIEDSVSVLKGIGPKKQAVLEKTGVYTIEDLLCLFPREYEDRRSVTPVSDIKEGKPALIRGRLLRIVSEPFRRGRKQILRLLISDDSGKLEVVFFNAGYLSKTLKQGQDYYFYGKPVSNSGKMQLVHPDCNLKGTEAMQGILPVYPLTSGIRQKEMRSWQKAALSCLEGTEEYLPQEIIERNRLCSLEYAFSQVHFPSEKQKLLEGKYRLVFDELLVLQTGLLAAKYRSLAGRQGLKLLIDGEENRYIEGLPYELTAAQRKVVSEIMADMESGKVMNRLVQGDVGSGKTAVAEIALYKTVKNGYQGVMMAPTEILAKQHYEGFKKNFAPYGIKVGLLTGSLTAKEKKKVLEELAQGEIGILVGTHAVIQPGVIFSDLGLVVTDEQHRFGVKQRTALSEKGRDPHILVMTATPIPRTLAVILYGDLDVSVIDQLPPGRQAIQTRAVNDRLRDECYDFVEKELKKGRQAYVVTPLIEESESLDVRSAEEVYEELKSRFSSYTTALLHGAMKQQQKDEIMNRFYKNEIQVLVSTVVIEVGINVPNATVMVVENSERFGLAQLHQLRGRVGRGTEQSYCILISKKSSEVAQKRAEIMEASQDGFYIAEQDLKLRGPGEIFGTRQHGVPDLVIADLARHLKILEDVKKEAEAIIEEDPFLETYRYAGIKKRILKLFGCDFALKL